METMKEDINGRRKTLNRCEVLHEGYRPVLKKALMKKSETNEQSRGEGRRAERD